MHINLKTPPVPQYDKERHTGSDRNVLHYSMTPEEIQARYGSVSAARDDNGQQIKPQFKLFKSPFARI